MKEIIKKWVENPAQLSIEDAATIIQEYCKIYGDREITGEQLAVIFHIHQNIMPIRFEKLIKFICIHYGYKYRELWSTPDPAGNRRLIRCYFDD